ncbi:MAG: hypothetical protein ACK55I_42930, partial [bacterium]
MLQAAEKAREMREMTAQQEVLWDSKGKWHLERPRGKPRVEPQSPLRSDDAIVAKSAVRRPGTGMDSLAS